MTAETGMRALSLQQPWAELVVSRKKTEEYRSRRTNIRGTVYVYACKGSNTLPEHMDEINEDYDTNLDLDSLPRGVIIGTVEVVDCTEEGGKYVWCLDGAKRLKNPPPVIGVPQPGFFWPFKPGKTRRA